WPMSPSCSFHPRIRCSPDRSRSSAQSSRLLGGSSTGRDGCCPLTLECSHHDSLGVPMTAHAGFVHDTADVAPTATISAGSKVWHYAQVREDATLGENCVVGRGAYIGTGVEVGDNCKIQNYALVYEPAKLARGVFIGPAVVLTNDHFPRAINADGSPKSADDWHPVGVDIREGASIGANSTCIAPIVIGR